MPSSEFSPSETVDTTGSRPPTFAEGQSPLARHMEKLLREESKLLLQSPVLIPLRAEIERSCERLKQPVRVAIVGLIKAGKSTLMNALLGEILVPTGAVEATFNVNWFHYGAKPELCIHYRDGRAPEIRPFSDLEEMTRRSEEHMEQLLQVAYIEVKYPADVLRKLHLVDTPGLASSYENDSENTLRFLQMHGEKITAITQAEAASADATLYLFNQGVAETDMGIVEAFLGGMGARLTPLNALGILTKADVYWNPPDPMFNPVSPDPLEVGRAITQRLMQNPRLRNAFYALDPVCGLLAEGAAALTRAEFDALARLAGSPDEQEARKEVLTSLLSSASRFCTGETATVPVSPAERQTLLKRLGQYGIWCACERLWQGDATQAEVTEWLLAHSGVQRIRERIINHFGNRAALIKIAAVLTSLRNCWYRLSAIANAEEQQAGLRFLGALERLELEEHAFQELRVLRDFYEGKLKLSAKETEKLRAVTGENGMDVWARLGASSDTAFVKLKTSAEEEIRFWAYRANDRIYRDAAAQSAASVLQRSCERIRHQLVQAEAALQTASSGYVEANAQETVQRYLKAGAGEIGADAVAELEAMSAPDGTVWNRLGLSAEAPLETLLASAKTLKNKWQAFAGDPLAYSSRTQQVAHIQARAYERMEVELRRACERLHGSPQGVE